MYKKKTIVMCLALLMPLSLPLIAEETSSGDSASAQSSESPLATPAAEAPASPSTSAGNDRFAAMQERLRERDARYKDLKERAKEAGVMLPDQPPWRSSGRGMMPDMNERMQRHQAMMPMTPEERMAAREERYSEMQARAKERGIEMPETPPWEARQSAMDEAWVKHQAVIEGMSDEERAACHAMHRRHMGMMRRGMPERPMMRGPGAMGPGTMGPGTMGPGTMGPGWGPGWGPGPESMGPGYGYGPGYAPNPYGPRNFWDPNR